MITRHNTELDTVINFAIANNTYTRTAIIDTIRHSQSPELVQALNCCIDEGTLDTGIQFFIDNPHVYPEAQVENNIHNHHVCQHKAMLAYAYGSKQYLPLVPPSVLNEPPELLNDCSLLSL